MGVFEDQARNKSDWTDQDLLMFDEAEERLVALEKEIVDQLGSGPQDEYADALTQRLWAVRSILERYRSR